MSIRIGKPVRLVRWLALLLVVVLLAGCGVSENSEGLSTQEGERQSLVLAISGEPEAGFDPVTGWGRTGALLFQSALFTRNSELELQGDLATGYEVSEDGRVWTVTLREGVQFSDGTPLTAADVQFTFEQAAASGSVIDLTYLVRVRAEGSNRVVFELAGPRSAFSTVLSTLGIVPAHAYGPDYNRSPIGSGPYKLVEWTVGQQLLVEANPLYYGERPYFDQLTFLFLDEAGALAAARSGAVDVAALPLTYGRQEVQGMQLVQLTTVDNRGIAFPVVPPGEATADGKPIGNAVTSDVAMRKAINLAIDREALVAGVLEGYGRPAFSSTDGLPWGNPDTVFADARLDEAKQLLEEAGWQDADGDGVREKQGVPARFTLLYPASDGTRQSLALAVVDQLRPLGVEVTTEGGSWETLGRRMHADAVLFGWGSHDPLEQYHLYSSAYRGVDFFNPGYYSNPQVDAWMEQALSAEREEHAWALWSKAQWDGQTGTSFQGDAPWAWLVNVDHLYLVHEQLSIGEPAIQPHGHGWPLTANIAEWRWTS